MRLQNLRDVGFRVEVFTPPTVIQANEWTRLRIRNKMIRFCNAASSDNAGKILRISVNAQVLLHLTAMVTRICAAAVLLVFALAAAAQSTAQDWNNVRALAVGTSVRISVGSRTVRGQVQSVADDSLAVDSGKGQEMFPRQEVTRVSVKKQGHRGRNTLIGLGAGAAIGVVVGVASHKDCTGFCVLYTTRGQDAGIGAVVFGVIGTAVGALIPTGGWREVYRQ